MTKEACVLGKVVTSRTLLSQAVQLQTRYVALLTTSADHHRFLGDLLKHLEELKVPPMCSRVLQDMSFMQG